MSLLSVTRLPDLRHLQLWDQVHHRLQGTPPEQWTEKLAEVQLSGLLQATQTGHLLVGVPTALIRGVYDAMTEPGISLPTAVDGGAMRAGIVVMTPEELESIGGPGKVTERGKPFTYQLGRLEEAPAKNWPGIKACWHLQIKAPELGELRRSYGLPTKLPGDHDFSIVVACRKVGVLGANATSKSTHSPDSHRLPDWTLPTQLG